VAAIECIIFALCALYDIKMASKQYVNVTMEKETLRKLSEIDPTKPLKALIDQAITEYIANRTFSVTSKTPGIGMLKVNLTSNAAGVLNTS
jgi:hypothetical protein